MGGLMSRNKGKRAEREVIALIQPVVTDAYEQARKRVPVLQRNTIQSDLGGHDISGLEWLSLEVKHHAKSAIPGWWRQCTEQAATMGVHRSLTPVLFYRMNHMPFTVRMWTSEFLAFCGDEYECEETHVDMEILDFQIYLYRRLCSELRITPL